MSEDPATNAPNLVVLLNLALHYTGHPTQTVSSRKGR